MNREDIIRMAREAGLHLPYWADDEDPKKDPPRWTMVSPLPPLLERFAALVAKAAIQDDLLWQAETETAVLAEREACAKVCESMRPSEQEFDQRFYTACTLNANAIRARGKA
jgi:hypothetical protein